MTISWTATRAVLRDISKAIWVIAVPISPLICMLAVIIYHVVITTLIEPLMLCWKSTFGRIHQKRRLHKQEKFKSSNTETYTDLPIKPYTRQIRILEVIPESESASSKGDIVQCEMSVQTWDSCRYEALSYHWGNLDLQHQIVVNNRPFMIANNLYKALKHLRQAEHRRLIWIDAICIDQGNEWERSRLVSAMNEIYRSAQGVVVWLGEKSRCCSNCMKKENWVFQFANLLSQWEFNRSQVNENTWLRATYDQGLFEINACHLRHRLDPEVEPAIWGILSKPWWDRMWVVQEVVVARKVRLQYSDFTISWKDFGLLFDILGGNNVPYEVLDSIRHQYHHPASSDPGYELLGLLAGFQDKKATDERDMLYGLIGLLPSHERAMIVPNYSHSFDVVVRDFVINCIKHYRSLLVLNVVGQWLGAFLEDGTHENLRSWTHFPFWTRPVRGYVRKLWSAGNSDLPRIRGFEVTLQARKSDRFQAFDSLEAEAVNWPVPWDGTFAASAGCPAAECVHPLNSNIIVLKGFVYDTIAACGSLFTHKVSDEQGYVKEWRSMCRGAHPDPDSAIEARFQRTLTAGIWNFVPDKSESNAQHTYNWHRRAACRFRRFFLTKGGRFGLAYDGCKAGDKICILLGADVPFLLRDRSAFLDEDGTVVEGKKTRSGVDRKFAKLQQFMGETYLDEIMRYKGDFGRDVEEGKLVLQNFFI